MNTASSVDSATEQAGASQAPAVAQQRPPAGPLQSFQYDNQIVWMFLIATLAFAVIAMVMGVLVAFQIYNPSLNFENEYTSFGRTRPLHTNAAIFAFIGNAIFAGVYYSLQRLLKTPMYSRKLSLFHFWGWQAIILAAAVTIPLGITTSKEYAEL
jgi:cytochrome c oxidase cbb3-type subunit I/II